MKKKNKTNKILKQEMNERTNKIKLELANRLFKVKEEFDIWTLKYYYKVTLNKKIVGKQIGCIVTEDGITHTKFDILNYLLRELLNSLERETAKEIFNNPHTKYTHIVIDTQVPENKILIAINPNTYAKNVTNTRYFENIISHANMELTKNEKEKS